MSNNETLVLSVRSPGWSWLRVWVRDVPFSSLGQRERARWLEDGKDPEHVWQGAVIEESEYSDPPNPHPYWDGARKAVYGESPVDAADRAIPWRLVDIGEDMELYIHCQWIWDELQAALQKERVEREAALEAMRQKELVALQRYNSFLAEFNAMKERARTRKEEVSVATAGGDGNTVPKVVADGHRVLVDGKATPFAVTSYNQRRVRLHGWDITHLPSGMTVSPFGPSSTYRTKNDAAVIAGLLSKVDVDWGKTRGWVDVSEEAGASIRKYLMGYPVLAGRASAVEVFKDRT